MKYTILLALLIFASCYSQKKMVDTTEVEDRQDGDTILSLVVSDPYSGTEQAETVVIRDAKSLQQFYSLINRTRKPGLPLPDIDFSREMVVVRCSGTTDDGAMPNLYLRGETQNEMLLGVRKTDEESNSSAVTTPFSVYRMPVTEKEVVVKE